MSATNVVAGWQYRNSVRARWVLIMGAIFALMCVVVTLLAFRTVRELGLTGIGPASATLVNLGVLLPSLMGLLLGAGSVVADRESGMLSMMCAQPIRRSSVATGAFLGLTGSLWSTLGIGFGVSMLILAGVAKSSDVPALATLIGATFAVAAGSVSIGVMVSTLVRSRVQAVSIAVGLWIVLSLGVDLALAALAPSLHMGPGALLFSILVNPLEAGRILALLGTNFHGTALGPFGAYLLERFGKVGTVLVLSGDLLAWIALPLMVARRAMSRNDL